jgi:glutathione S-transferase
MAAAGAEGSCGGEDGGLTLLGFWSSPYVLRARFVLNLKGIPYKYVEEELFGDGTKSALLLASNPAHGGKVPVLLHHGRPVAESLVIAEYIDEAFPDRRPRLLPSDPHERATARFWAVCVEQKMVPAWAPVFCGRTLEERVKAAGELVAVLETFEGVLAGGRMEFFGGESAGLVDVALGGFLWWLRASEAMCGVKTIDPARTPLVAAWAERFSALDGVREIAPDVPRLAEYHLAKRAGFGLPFLPLHQPPQ